MSVHTSANRFPIDSLTILRASGKSTIAATAGSDTYLTLDQLSAYWSTADNANQQEFAVVCQVESISAASGTPTAAFSIQIDTDSAFTSPTPITVLSGKSVTVAGYETLVVSKETILKALSLLSVTTAVPVYLQVVLTIAGGATTPAVAWNAYVAPLLG